MKVSYNWLQTFFENGALPSVDNIEQKLIFHAYEVEGVEKIGDDYVIDVDVLPNRSSDSMSHRGIAREISTLFELPMKYDPFAERTILEPVSDKVELILDDEEACPVHTLALVKGVKVGESPKWLRDKLEALGQRSINNIVDATNYIMYGLGQPSHAFDYDKLTEESDGTRGIRVRAAKNGEELELLGGTSVTMAEGMYVLADVHSDEPLDVAGVKGGVHAELDDNTKNVLVSVAKFHPTTTRITSQRLKLRTDASARYENEIPDQLPAIGIKAVVQLILEIAGGELDGYARVGDADRKNNEIRLSIDYIEKYLGVRIKQDEVVNILNRLDFVFEQVDNIFIVTAPFYRLDINIPEELIEEIGRVYGYSNITPLELPTVGVRPSILKKYAAVQQLRKVLIKEGYLEMMLYSLRNNGDVKLKNSLNREKDHMRDNLSDGVEEALERNEVNMPLLGEYDFVRVFEIGNIFTKDSEDTNVCIGVRAIGNKKRDTRTAQELAKINSVIESELDIRLPDASGQTIELNIMDVVDQLDTSSYVKVGAVDKSVQFAPMSLYPFIVRDIAMWVPDNTDEGIIKDIVFSNGDGLVQRVDKFDEFTKDGRISLAFHIVFQSKDKTLTDNEVGVIMGKIEEELGSQDGFELR